MRNERDRAALANRNAVPLLDVRKPGVTVTAEIVNTLRAVPGHVVWNDILVSWDPT